jgi:dihydroneopterin aldolase
MRLQKYKFDGTHIMLSTTVFLEKLRYHLPLGLYAGEKLCGNEILISVSVTMSKRDEEALQHWLNYELLHQIILKNVEQTHELLETLAQQILADVREEAAACNPQQIEVMIEKPNLPISAFQARSAGVSLRWSP